MNYVAIRTAPRAGKDGYVCDQCHKPIEKGVKYVRLWYPPYHPLNRFEGDVDDDGRSIAVEIPETDRKSFTHRLHEDCEHEYMEYHY